MTLKEFKQQFDPLLIAHLQEKAVRLGKLSENPIIRAWLDHCVALAPGGKCLRAYLAYVFYLASGGKDEKRFFQTSIFFEIFHLFALVHDDIVDEGIQRRGLTTAHKFIEASLKDDGRRGNLAHVAEGHAMLLGDLLLSWTYDVVIFSNVSDMDRLLVQKHLQDMVDHVVIGEMMDIDLCTRETATKEQIMQKSRLKSGDYTILYPMALGASFAGSEENVKLAFEIGEYGGLAFQIQDDLLDITSSSAHLGKAVMNDLFEGQHTFFTQYVVDHGTAEQRKILNDLRYHHLSLAEQAQARAVFEESGALKAGKDIITEYYAKAQELIEKADLLPAPKKDLMDLFEMLKGRSK